MKRSLMEEMPDRRRVCVMLRAAGMSYMEISEFLNIGPRLVRYELEQATHQFPGLLDHGRGDNQNRIIRLVYLMGAVDAGATREELPDMLDALEERSRWIRSRMISRGRMDQAGRRRKKPVAPRLEHPTRDHAG